MLRARIVIVTKTDAAPTLTEIRQETKIKQADVIKSSRVCPRGVTWGRAVAQTLSGGPVKASLRN